MLSAQSSNLPSPIRPPKCPECGKPMRLERASPNPRFFNLTNFLFKCDCGRESDQQIAANDGDDNVGRQHPSTSREDLLKRAAECEQLIDREDDERKSVFRLIRNMWVALANEHASMNPEELSQEVTNISQMQLSFQGKGNPL